MSTNMFVFDCAGRQVRVTAITASRREVLQAWRSFLRQCGATPPSVGQRVAAHYRGWVVVGAVTHVGDTNVTVRFQPAPGASARVEQFRLSDVIFSVDGGVSHK